MQRVSIVGFPGALASTITGMIDLFQLAGVTWARIQGERPERRFEVRLLTSDGGPCQCLNGIALLAHGSLADADPGDLILVPTIGGPIEETLEQAAPLLDWLRQQADQGKSIASNCTGAFLLAEAGLLDGRKATTHWGFSPLFRQRYPNVDCVPEQLVTVDGPIACAGGGTAWWDLGILLIERYAGAQVARELAKAFVVDAGRRSQAPYAALQTRRYHQDDTILALQDWLDGRFTHPLSMEDMAHQSGLSSRSLLRRFKAATGETPHRYLQLLRVESARHLLETTARSVEQITQAVGYEDVSSFSRLFKDSTGLSPNAYRSRLGR
ncbi:GlxA family transcriptional regulator [Marinobacter sp. R17]|uniref:GlxA family transcriptional regulator n=1 Tax=Marinobacter sp. R17 TaxID=2484250 RepID=UPI000F4B409F|nr:GlxA family transcriptional regulator [Marinobacter sp. R17]ROU02144.1 GlxA family transcriptional regulator [Marinobacter sp. R17]